MGKKQFSFRHLLAAFACGVLLVGGVSLTAPHRVSSGVYGDVNGDGVVDVDDLNEVINVIVGKATPKETYTVNGVSFTMVTVEGGTFTMGAADGDSEADATEKPAHQVTLSSYSIGQTEVTQELWQAVMGSNPSKFSDSNGYTDHLRRPVESVSWDDCQTFITKLNRLTGQNFRLPTEAEWEFAARGGNKSKGYKYAGSNTIDDMAWYWETIPSHSSSESNYGPQPVATKKPNELGLYDMSGNVNEWCQDWKGNYSSDAQTNPTGPTSGTRRAYRGGYWAGTARYCRVTYRLSLAPSKSEITIGLRLAL